MASTAYPVEHDRAPSISGGESLTESTHTSSSILSKSKILKKKLKHKLHLDHGAGQEGDSEEGDEYEDDDDSITTGYNGGVTPHAGPGGITPAQAYAESHTWPVHTGGDPYFTAQDGTAPVHSPVTTASGPSVPNTPAKAASIRSRNGSTSTHVTQSDWKRKAEFHNLFEGKVDEEEHLISDYTCAWAKDILRHGRLYVGAQHLAFICTIIGLKCSVVIPFSDITSFEKTVTARVIPNAIAVTTKEGDIYTFSSFLYRDTSYDLLVDCWRSANPPAYDSFMSSQSTEIQSSIAEGTQESPFPTETAEPVTEQSAHAATQCSGGHFKEVALDVRFPSEPEKIFKLLYHDDEFQKQLCASQKLTDLKVKPWIPAATGKPGMEKREYQYTKPLNGSVGPSSAICYITDEELVKETDGAFEVLSITKTPDVPSGGSFEIHTKSCLTWAGGSKGGARMLVTTECVWSGRSMIKGIVTSASIAGQRDYNKGLAKEVRKHIQAHPAEYGSGDINAPEADDEIGTDATADASGSTEEKSVQAPGVLGSIGRTVQKNELAAAILVISNAVLLIAFLVSLFRGRGVKITKTVLGEQAEVEALARLTRLEASWAEFKAAVDVLAVRTP